MKKHLERHIDKKKEIVIIPFPKESDSARRGKSHQFCKPSSAGLLKDSGRIILRAHSITLFPFHITTSHEIYLMIV